MAILPRRLTFKPSEPPLTITLTPVFSAAVIGLMALVLLVQGLQQGNGSPLTFAWIGTRFAQGDPQGTTGYDGQFVYYIARDGAAAAAHLDNPAFRYQRILYPALARVAAFGHTAAIPWALVTINILAVAGGTGLIALLLIQHRVPAFASLIYGLWIGNLYGLRFSLIEPLCCALALGAVLAYTHQRYRWTVLLLILSTATKELGVLFALGLALHAAVTRRQWRWSLLLAGGPLLFVAVWWLLLYGWFGTLPSSSGGAQFAWIPLSGLLAEDSAAELAMLIVWLALPALALLVLMFRKLWQTRQLSLSMVLLLIGAGFTLIMPAPTWVDPVAAYRVATPLVIGGLLFVAEHYPRRWGWLAALWLPTALLFMLLMLLLSTLA